MQGVHRTPGGPADFHWDCRCAGSPATSVRGALRCTTCSRPAGIGSNGPPAQCHAMESLQSFKKQKSTGKASLLLNTVLSPGFVSALFDPAAMALPSRDSASLLMNQDASHNGSNGKNLGAAVSQVAGRSLLKQFRSKGFEVDASQGEAGSLAPIFYSPNNGPGERRGRRCPRTRRRRSCVRHAMSAAESSTTACTSAAWRTRRASGAKLPISSTGRPKSVPPASANVMPLHYTAVWPGQPGTAGFLAAAGCHSCAKHLLCASLR